MKYLLFTLFFVSNLGVFSQTQHWHYGAIMSGVFFEAEIPNKLIEKRLSPSVNLFAERMICPHFSLSFGLGYFCRNYRYNVVQYLGLVPSAVSHAHHLSLPISTTTYLLKNRRLALSLGLENTLFFGYQFIQLTDLQGNKLPQPQKTQQFLWSLSPSKFTPASPFDITQFYTPRWQVTAQYRLPIEAQNIDFIVFGGYSQGFANTLPQRKNEPKVNGIHLGIKIGR